MSPSMSLQSRVRHVVAQAQRLLVLGLRHTPLRPRRTVLLSYTAPRSGRDITLPVWSVRHGEDWLVAVGASGAKTWWKAFRRQLDVTIDADGTHHRLRGGLETDPAEHARLLAIYRAGLPRAAAQPFGETSPLLVFRPVAA